MEREAWYINALPKSTELRKEVHDYLKGKYSNFKIIDFNFHESLLSPVRDEDGTKTCAYVSALTCVEMLYRKSNIKVVADCERQYFEIDSFFEKHYKNFLDLAKLNEAVDDLGTSMSKVLNYVKKYGLVVTSAWREPRTKNLYSHFCGKVPRGKISSFETLEPPKAFKYAKDTPMIACINIHPSFVGVKKVIYKGPSKHEIARARARDPDCEESEDEHAVVIVGNAIIRIENKIKKFFIIQNSYGISFGYNGFTLMHSKHFDEIWLVKVPLRI